MPVSQAENKYGLQSTYIAAEACALQVRAILCALNDVKFKSGARILWNLHMGIVSMKIADETQHLSWETNHLKE